MPQSSLASVSRDIPGKRARTAGRTAGSMQPGAALRVYRLGVAAAILAAVCGQFVHNLGTPGFNPLNFFSYFTIQSNLFGALVLVYVASRPASDVSARLDLVRGAAVLALSLTGVVFSVLLAGTDVGDMVPWANLIVHYVAPLAIVADWLIDPPRARLSPRQSAWWLAFPLLYAIYTLVRGAAVHWYPYPFLDVDVLGYAGMSRYAAVILLGLVVSALLVVAAGNALRARRTAA
jgi:hypothetical protein